MKAVWLSFVVLLAFAVYALAVETHTEAEVVTCWSDVDTLAKNKAKAENDLQVCLSAYIAARKEEKTNYKEMRLTRQKRDKCMRQLAECERKRSLETLVDVFHTRDASTAVLTATDYDEAFAACNNVKTMLTDQIADLTLRKTNCDASSGPIASVPQMQQNNRVQDSYIAAMNLQYQTCKTNLDACLAK